LHVEENQVRPSAADFREGFPARSTFADDLNFRVQAQEHGEVAARQRLIVNDERSYLRDSGPCLQPYFSRNGTESSTSTPEA
jgi:hypothetical protein